LTCLVSNDVVAVSGDEFVQHEVRNLIDTAIVAFAVLETRMTEWLGAPADVLVRRFRGGAVSKRR
jgi:hypothetical protein